MITELEAQRRQVAAQIDKLNAPNRAAQLAEQQLADLEQQIAEARQQEENEARERQRHENQIAAATLAYNAISPALVEALRSIHFARQQLIDLGEPDPGDKLLSVQAIAAPTVEQGQRAYQILREAETRDRATPAQVAAHNQRRQLTEQIHMVTGQGWDEAAQLAAAVVDGELSLEDALSSITTEKEHEFNF